MTDRICIEADCPTRAGRRDLCDKHYARLQRLGAFARTPQSAECVIDGCDGRPMAARLCVKHYTRRYRYGDPSTVKGGPEGTKDLHHNWTGSNATYRAVHKRLTRERGLATGHPCVDCGDAAANWSYDNHCSDERTTVGGLAYSTHLYHYVARCFGCHKRFDNAHARRRRTA